MYFVSLCLFLTFALRNGRVLPGNNPSKTCHFINFTLTSISFYPEYLCQPKEQWIYSCDAQPLKLKLQYKVLSWTLISLQTCCLLTVTLYVMFVSDRETHEHRRAAELGAVPWSEPLQQQVNAAQLLWQFFKIKTWKATKFLSTYFSAKGDVFSDFQPCLRVLSYKQTSWGLKTKPSAYFKWATTVT